MIRDHDRAIAALIQATNAPGAVAKLNDLGMTPLAAQQIIKHLSTIPAFERNLAERLDQGPALHLAELDAERLVFLHIPKCGGTTLHDLLVGWYGANRLHPERHNGLYFYAARHLASKTLFSGHYDYYGTQLVPGQKHLITFLRNPRDRLISLYNFHRSHRDDVIAQYNLTLARWANMYDINDYFANPEVRSNYAINNTMARHFSNEPQFGDSSSGLPVEVLRDQAIANLSHFDFIGLTEKYETSISRLAALLGKTPPKMINKARNFATLIETDPNMKRIEKQVADEKTHQLMQDLVCEDEAIYAHAETLFGAA